jgi:hypothetical protein
MAASHVDGNLQARLGAFDYSGPVARWRAPVLGDHLSPTEASGRLARVDSLDGTSKAFGSLWAFDPVDGLSVHGTSVASKGHLG